MAGPGLSSPCHLGVAKDQEKFAGTGSQPPLQVGKCCCCWSSEGRRGQRSGVHGFPVPCLRQCLAPGGARLFKQLEMMPRLFTQIRLAWWTRAALLVFEKRRTSRMMGPSPVLSVVPATLRAMMLGSLFSLQKGSHKSPGAHRPPLSRASMDYTPEFLMGWVTVFEGQVAGLPGEGTGVLKSSKVR